jgi:hypothetical protein
LVAQARRDDRIAEFESPHTDFGISRTLHVISCGKRLALARPFNMKIG